MEQESVVYGIIRDVAWIHGEEGRYRREHNLSVLAALPDHEGYPLLGRHLFAESCLSELSSVSQTSIIHFGMARRGIEYEWKSWMEAFETLLGQLYWVQARLHLETEYAGQHTFVWEPQGESHLPHMPMDVRCAWEHEVGGSWRGQV